VTVVSDSSPLITLARIRCFDLLHSLYSRIYISTAVHKEVVIDGSTLPGALEVSRCGWIEVKAVQNTDGLAAAVAKTGLGVGEASAVMLAKELSADLILIDEWKARRYAISEGLRVIGCVGILESLYEQGHVSDLRDAYQELIHQKTRIDLQTLQRSLAEFKLPPL
jgi:predicted nucleic acid-binding protein